MSHSLYTGGRTLYTKLNKGYIVQIRGYLILTGAETVPDIVIKNTLPKLQLNTDIQDEPPPSPPPTAPILASFQDCCALFLIIDYFVEDLYSSAD